jgi:hypothetical protein
MMSGVPLARGHRDVEGQGHDEDQAVEAVHIFIDFGQLCSSKPATHVHGNRPAVFMISATRFQAGQHP